MAAWVRVPHGHPARHSADQPTVQEDIVETLPLFPIDNLTVTPAIEPEPEETIEPLLTVIPGQLDLFTGEVAA